MLSHFILTGVLHTILLRLLLLRGTRLLRWVPTWSLVLLVHLTCEQKQEIVQRHVNSEDVDHTYLPYNLL